MSFLLDNNVTARELAEKGVIIIKLYDYGNGIKEVRQFYRKEGQKPPLDDFVRIDKDYTVNKKTGEVKERSVPTTKADVKDIQRGMLREFRLLFYNINKAIPNGSVYFITLTNKELIDYDQFNYNLDKYIKKLKYANAQESDESFKYAFFKEADTNGRYHVHGLVWFLDKQKLHLTEDIICSKWCFGMGLVKEIPTTEDLIKTLYYLTNYSNKDKANQKVIRKKKGLTFFPPNTHLVARTRNLEEVPFEEIADAFVPDEETIISQSERDQKNIYYQSTFYKED